MEEFTDAKTLLDSLKLIRHELNKHKSCLEDELNVLDNDLQDELNRGEELLSSLTTNTFNLDVEIGTVKTTSESEEAESLSTLYKKYENLSNKHSYLTCIGRVADLNELLKVQCQLRDWDGVAKNFRELASMASILKSSHCRELSKYVKMNKKVWKIFLKKLFHDALDEILKTHGYPAEDSIKNLIGFRSSLRNTVVLFDALRSHRGSNDFDEFTDCLLTPLRKRFVYHFADPKRLLDVSPAIADNNLPKPEWYLSLILKWHQKYTSIFQTLNDGIDNPDDSLDPTTLSAISLDFARGLVILARERFKFDLTLVLTSDFYANNDNAFPHLIDEAVSFDMEMRECGYGESEVGCVELLTEPGIFERWFELEQQQCTRCMETLLADKSAWNVRYSDATDLDQFKVPRCIDNFFSLLTALTHRYKLLRSHQHRQQFVRLQRNLIDDFRMHLFQMTRASTSPWAIPFPQIINATAYVKLVLSNWQELPFFLDLEPGVFDELIDLFAHFNRQMLRAADQLLLNFSSIFSDAKEAVLEETKYLAAMYRKEINGPNFDENSLAVILVPLQARLMEVRDVLNQINFRDWLKSFTVVFEKLLIENVILEVRVDSKLGTELQNQLAFVLPRLLHSFGLPDSIYFQKLCQSLSVYALNSASCILLKAALQDQSENVVDNVLNEMNLTLLTRSELDALLQRRSDINI